MNHLYYYRYGDFCLKVWEAGGQWFCNIVGHEVLTADTHDAVVGLAHKRIDNGSIQGDEREILRRMRAKGRRSGTKAKAR